MRTALVFCRIALAAVVVVGGAAAGGKVAHAGGKPTVAVLGLEIVDDGSGLDPKMTQLAADLTEALRRRPKSGTGPYAPAPGADKDLAELKFIRNCDNEAPACMAQIGTELSADFMLYGKVEKRTGGVQVSFKLFDVAGKQVLRSTTEMLPTTESATDLERDSKTFYAKIAGVPETAPPVAANVVALAVTPAEAQVVIDGHIDVALTNGAASVPGLSPGDHTAMVTAAGYVSEQITITVVDGQDTKAAVALTKLTTPPPEHTLPPVEVGPGGVGPANPPLDTTLHTTPGRSGGGYRALFYGSAAVAVAGTAAWVFSWSQINDAEDALPKNYDCSSATTISNPTYKSACDQGKSNSTYTAIEIPVAAVAGAVAIFSFYKGFIAAKNNASDDHAGIRRRHKRDFAIEPVIAPSGVGATVRIDF